MSDDYSDLCLFGSKECTRISDLAYADLPEEFKLEVAHGMFAFLSFACALAPMFIVNAWINPQSTRYETSIKNNGFQDFHRTSYLYFAIFYGVPSVLTPFTYFIESG